MTSISVEHISKTPGVCGGKACIAGHRVRVLDIATLYEGAGLTPQQIVERLPTITLADVHAAIAYFLDHREEIEAESQRAHEVAEQYRERFPSKLKGTVLSALQAGR
jgi:uncharacterized protein (DUF433 family)